MKTIIYGTNPEMMLLVSDSFGKITGKGYKDWLMYCKKTSPQPINVPLKIDTQISSIIFVGFCPKEELKIALNKGLKVLILMAPLMEIKHPNVIMGKTQKQTDKEAIIEDLKTLNESFKNSFQEAG